MPRYAEEDITMIRLVASKVCKLIYSHTPTSETPINPEEMVDGEPFYSEFFGVWMRTVQEDENSRGHTDAEIAHKFEVLFIGVLQAVVRLLNDMKTARIPSDYEEAIGILQSLTDYSYAKDVDWSEHIWKHSKD